MLKVFMIKKFLLIALCCGLVLPVFSQKLFLSEAEDFNIRTDDFAVVGKYGKSVITYRKRNGKAEIIFYSENMIKQKSLSLDFLPNNFSNVRFVCDPNHLLVFYESKELKKQQLYASKLLAGDLWRSPVLLSSKPISMIKDYVPFNLSVSENGKRILFFNSYYLAGDNTVQAVIVDEQLNILKEIHQIFPDKEYFFSEKSIVSDKGLPYLLATNRPSNKGNVEELKVLTLADYSKDLFVFPIVLEGHHVSDLQIAADNENGNICIASFFADGKYAAPRGIFLCNFDEGKQATTAIHFVPIVLQISKSNTDLKDLRVRNLFLKRDGGVEIVAEKYYQNIRTINSINPIVNSSFMTGPDNARSVTEFYYDEVYIFNFKVDGSLHWSQTILKEQLSTDDGGIFSSFAPFRYPIGNVYLFNDLSSNATRLLASYISSTGEMSMKEIQTSEQIDEWNIMPRSGKQISKSELIIPCMIKNNVSFLKIKF